MFQVIIGTVCFCIFILNLFLYLWFLFWPSVDATIERVEEGGRISPGTSYKKTHRVISYSFQYKGNKYNSSRQGLITAKGFAKKYYIQEKFQLKVCPIFIKLSCPNRIIFETLIFSLISVVSLLTGYYYYNEMYGS